MTIELDDRTMNIIAKKVADVVLRELRGTGCSESKYISCGEAAKKLGISTDRLRKTKNKYTYVKRGEDNQSRLYFDENSLFVSLF